MSRKKKTMFVLVLVPTSSAMRMPAARKRSMRQLPRDQLENAGKNQMMAIHQTTTQNQQRQQQQRQQQ
jgi:hypothetical protein